MVVKLVLNGGIKSCCSVTPTELVRKAVREWLPETDELIVIDKETEPWTPDKLALLAQSYFKDAIFPLVYIGERLAMIGGIPNRRDLLDMTDGKIEFGVSEIDILEAAKSMGYLHEEEAAAL
jgi:hypothetical protein